MNLTDLTHSDTALLLIALQDIEMDKKRTQPMRDHAKRLQDKILEQLGYSR